MRLHKYSVFARFRYNDLKVGISSGNQALKRCAFVDTDLHKQLAAAGTVLHEYRRDDGARMPRPLPYPHWQRY